MEIVYRPNFVQNSANHVNTDFAIAAYPDLLRRPVPLCGLRLQQLHERHPVAIWFAESLKVAPGRRYPTGAVSLESRAENPFSPVSIGIGIGRCNAH